MDDLKLLKRIKFDWVVRSESVWKDPIVDVEAIHADAREDLIYALDDLMDSDESECPLGMVLMGSGGTGKTHLLQWLRQQAFGRNMTFLFADMTGVRDFWETIQSQMIAAIDQELPDGYRQCQHVLAGLLNAVLQNPKKEPIVLADKMAKWTIKQTVNYTGQLVENLTARHRTEMSQHRDVLRALIMLNSDKVELNNAAHAWLHGTETDEELLRHFDFTSRDVAPINIVQGISWLLSLRGPTVLAIDQLDNLAAQQIDRFGSLSEGRVEEILDDDDEARRLLSITHSVMDGLADLVQTAMRRTQVVVSCYDTTWDYMAKKARRAAGERYGQQLPLSAIPTGEAARRMVEGRLATAAKRYGYVLPSSSWPFASSAFEEAAGLTPREVLQACDRHRRHCLKNKRVEILTSFNTDQASVSTSVTEAPCAAETPEPPDPMISTLDEEFGRLKESANIGSCVDKDMDDQLWPGFLESALSALTEECVVPASVDLIVDGQMAGGKSYLYLHGRLRIVDHGRQAREQQFCFRALFHTHATAFQNRLKAAITDAGIDKQLGFRSLTAIRNDPPPRGAKTQQLVVKYSRMDGITSDVSEDEIRTLFALREILQSYGAEAHDWIRQRCFVSQLGFIQGSGVLEAIQEIGGSLAEPSKQSEMHEGGSPYATKASNAGISPADPLESRAIQAESVSESITPIPTIPQIPLPISTSNNGHFRLGISELPGGRLGDPIDLPWIELARHAFVVAGAGSGKTNLLKRIIEEAAIAGIPSIVVDCNNDLIQLGEPRPERSIPSEWTEEDRKKEHSFTACREVITWTPNRESGNPIALRLLPNFRELIDDPDDLKAAIQVACADMASVVAHGSSVASKKKRGVLSKVLESFARRGGDSVTGLIDMLRELPQDVDTGIAGQTKLATEMADLLQSELNSNPLWDAGGMPLDPPLLFGYDSQKTRISILSMVGLPKQSMQQTFLYQFAIPLLTWIKRNPAPDGSLRGLLVIDEAKEFVPSVQGSPCKEALVRLTAQARKYGLGIIFATQAPKDIDNRIPNNCFTQIYGQVNSPAAIETAIQFLTQKQAPNPGSVARLNKGQFFFYNGELLQRAQRIKTAQCLSHHTSPMTEDEVLERARLSRALLGS